MNNPLFEQAKQAVAEKHGFKDWNRLIIFGNGLPDLYYEEAAEMYAQWKANEAVKADRAKAIEELTEIHTRIEVIRVDDLRLLPLPFPQQPEQK